jgi:hypothetical protein
MQVNPKAMSLLNAFLNNPTQYTLGTFYRAWRKRAEREGICSVCLHRYLTRQSRSKKLHKKECAPLCVKLKQERKEHHGSFLCYTTLPWLKKSAALYSAWRSSPSTLILDLMLMKAYIKSEEDSHESRDSRRHK